ncbi:MAG: T9SS type A sorting domain-containing protein [Flavobacteriales bacterium]|nr:T9SS type A sorting domain-containing protein [Flavobacteriales bacterium]
MKNIFTIALCIWFAHQSFAQYIEPCGQVEYENYLEKQFPGFKTIAEESYKSAIENTKTKSHSKADPIDTVYHIQVVFHVVYNTNAQNIHDSLIINQLRVLNECYNRENADTINTRELFKPIAGNARIRFHLATMDPNGNPTNGITRTQTSRQTFYSSISTDVRDYVKSNLNGGIDPWNTKKYLNIWICNLNTSSGSQALLGFAYPPVNTKLWPSSYNKPDNLQGVVIHYEVIGENNPANLDRNKYNNEKTAVHEVGHYLGLRHIWGDAPFASQGCSYDDYIDDTPNSKQASSGCSKFANSCNDIQNDRPDMVENYMDYSSANCTNLFTERQINVMRYHLVNYRSELAKTEYIFPEQPISSNHFAALYPNPFENELSFSTDSIENSAFTMELYDMLGRKVYEQSKTKTDYIIYFDLTFLSAGTYLLFLKNEGVDLKKELVVKAI